MAIMHIVANLYNVAFRHMYLWNARQLVDMSSSMSESGGSVTKRIPVKEPTWRDLHDLKGAGQSYDDLISEMIRRERDYREWKMVAEIDKSGEYVAFDPDEIMKDD